MSNYKKLKELKNLFNPLMKKEIKDNVIKKRKINNNFIYHYTSFQNFINIIQTKQLWFSKIGEMNDATEGQWLKKVIQNTDIKLYNLFLKLQKDKSISFKGCFCENSDNLNLWRNYSDDAKGVALGFEIKKQSPTFNNAKSPISSMIMTDIRYCNLTDKNPKEIINNDLHFIKKHINNLQTQTKIKKVEGNQIIKNSNKNLFRRFNNIVKHICFEYEKELAVIITVTKKEIKNNPKFFNNLNNKFLFSVSQISKYANTVFKKDKQIQYYNLIFKQVILGPKNKINKKTITSILKANGFNNIKILKSKLPYI